MTDLTRSADRLTRKRATDYQHDLVVYALRSLAQALNLAWLAMTAVFVAIWVRTDQVPVPLLAGIAGVFAAGTLLWNAANKVPRAKEPPSA